MAIPGIVFNPLPVINATGEITREQVRDYVTDIESYLWIVQATFRQKLNAPATAPNNGNANAPLKTFMGQLGWRKVQDGTGEFFSMTVRTVREITQLKLHLQNHFTNNPANPDLHLVFSAVKNYTS